MIILIIIRRRPLNMFRTPILSAKSHHSRYSPWLRFFQASSLWPKHQRSRKQLRPRNLSNQRTPKTQARARSMTPGLLASLRNVDMLLCKVGRHTRQK